MLQVDSIMLLTSRPTTSSIEKGEYRRYIYRSDDFEATIKIQFQLEALHGDADIFVSRKQEFPKGKEENDKHVAQKYGLIDRIYYDKLHFDDLNGHFYITVKGNQYSTFMLEAKIEKVGETEWDLMQDKRLDKDFQLLSEGFTVYAGMHNEDHVHKFRIEVDQETGAE